MPETITLLAIFDEIEPASEGVDKLQQMGLHNDDMNVISGIPVKHTILGRPSAITYVSRIGMLGAIMGMFLGISTHCWSVGNLSFLCHRELSSRLR
jgi:hypothetical protein